MATMKTMSFGTLMLLLLLNYSGYTTAIRKCPMSISKYSFCSDSPAPAPEPTMPSDGDLIFPTPYIPYPPFAGTPPVQAPEPSKPSGEEPTTAPILAPEPSKPSGEKPTLAPVPAPGPSKPSGEEPTRHPRSSTEEPEPPELPKPNNA